VFTDIEGSTRAWEDSASEMDLRLRRHDEVLRGVFSRHGGRVFGAAGDGFAVVFDDVAGAVGAAGEVQAALAGGPVRVRVGIHVGTAVERDGDFFGPTLNRAARLMAAGHGGQVLLSEAAAALARPVLAEAVGLVDLGSHRLRDLSLPEHVWQLHTAACAGPFPPLRTVGAVASNLPVVDPLVGREADVAAVMELVASHRLVTITGAGGVGKSRLSLAVAHEVAGDMKDGCWLVELAPLGDASGLVAAVAGALPLPAPPATAAELVAQVGPRQYLLVVDNCEHLVDAVADLIAELVASCPRVRVLCTSREALAVDGEHVWPLRPLDSEPGAVLFGQRARAVRPDVVDDAAAVATIVERLDGLPLAIELAAARMSTFSAADIAAQLDDRFRLLSGGLRGRPARHQGLAAMVDWGHELLESAERRLFRRLGIFAGSFTRDAAAAVAAVEPGEQPGVVDDLDRLVRRSLVVAEMDAATRTTRFRLLETLRQYALDRLTEAGETQALGRRHAEWYAEHARAYEAVMSPDETMWLARGLADLDNLRAAVAFAVDHADTDLAVRLVGRSWRLHVLWHPELLRWARQVQTLPGAAVHPDIGYVHVIIASQAMVVGELTEAERSADEALRRELDEDAWASVSLTKGSILVFRGDFKGAIQPYVRAMERLQRPWNLVIQHARGFSGKAYTGGPGDGDPVPLIASADATGIPGVRSEVRYLVALGMVSRDRSVDTVPLVREALEIVEPGLNRFVVNIAVQMLALVSATGPTPLPPDDLSDRAARAVELDREYPSGMGFVLIGLVLSAHRLGHATEAALLVGYLAGHLEELELVLHSAEVMTGAPLHSFVTPGNEDEFERGRSMSRDGLMAELARLAAEKPA
jgi:predicted ATPase